MPRVASCTPLFAARCRRVEKVTIIYRDTIVRANRPRGTRRAHGVSARRKRRPEKEEEKEGKKKKKRKKGEEGREKRKTAEKAVILHHASHSHSRATTSQSVSSCRVSLSRPLTANSSEFSLTPLRRKACEEGGGGDGATKTASFRYRRNRPPPGAYSRRRAQKEGRRQKPWAASIYISLSW